MTTATRRAKTERATLGLTPRELEVFVSLSAGWPTRDIAQSLSISVKTVSKHYERMMTKLGVASTRKLIVAAVKWRYGIKD